MFTFDDTTILLYAISVALHHSTVPAGSKVSGRKGIIELCPFFTQCNFKAHEGG
jgi:hypothetical protein